MYGSLPLVHRLVIYVRPQPVTLITSSVSYRSLSSSRKALSCSYRQSAYLCGFAGILRDKKSPVRIDKEVTILNRALHNI